MRTQKSEFPKFYCKWETDVLVKKKKKKICYRSTLKTFNFDGEWVYFTVCMTTEEKCTCNSISYSMTHFPQNLKRKCIYFLCILTLKFVLCIYECEKCTRIYLICNIIIRLHCTPKCEAQIL